MTAAAMRGMNGYGEPVPPITRMKCFKKACPSDGLMTVTLLFYKAYGTRPAMLTPLGVLLCKKCALEAKVEDYLGAEGWEQVTAVFDQFGKEHPRRELTKVRIENLE